MTLNPLRAYFDYRVRCRELSARVHAVERAERRDERTAFLEAVKAMTAVSERAFDANRAQSEAFKGFIDSFKVTEVPTVREFDIDAYDDRYLAHQRARRASTGVTPLVDDLTAADLQARLGQFQMMLADMDND